LEKAPANTPGRKHWSDYVSWPRDVGPPDSGLVEFCQLFETVELWFDPSPNDQLQLIWLLDYLRLHPDILARLKLRLVSFDLNSIPLEGLGNWQVPIVDVGKDELETAGISWKAYRATTPQACVDLLARNSSALLLLKPALNDLLNELPSLTTGLGASEMRMLEMVAWGYASTNALFHLRSLRRTRVFSEWEYGYLLDGLAFGPAPAVAGLDEALRTIALDNLGARHPAYLRSHAKTPLYLTMVQADASIGDHTPEEVTRWRLPSVKIQSEHLEAASKAWQAYRQPTPQDLFNLLSEDISILPQLRQSVLELLEELPMPATGLGATEMRILKLISSGDAGPFDVFPGHQKPNKRRVFDYWEVGALLDGLAHCPAPAVSGLEEGPFTLEMHDDRDRLARYKQSRLELTALGKAVLSGTEDFSRHNPIHRW
jgi:hypothetical protein